MYLRTCSSSKPTVDTAYPRAQKCSPVKFRSLPQPVAYLKSELPGGPKFSDDFHVFTVEWEPNVVRFYTDEYLYATFVPAQLPAGKKWVFDHPFYIILNLAVGGDWPGAPDSTTEFPQQMWVDYVRVYKQAPQTGRPR